jgi:excisionase family DNA binding protein
VLANAEEFLSPEELADLLKVSRRTVYYWRARGTGPPTHKVGGALRYRRSDVEAWLADSAASS